MSHSIRYETAPRAPSAERYLVGVGTNRTYTLGLLPGDVLEVHPGGEVMILRAIACGPPPIVLEQLKKDGALARLALSP